MTDIRDLVAQLLDELVTKRGSGADFIKRLDDSARAELMRELGIPADLYDELSTGGDRDEN